MMGLSITWLVGITLLLDLIVFTIYGSDIQLNIARFNYMLWLGLMWTNKPYIIWAITGVNILLVDEPEDKRTGWLSESGDE